MNLSLVWKFLLFLSNLWIKINSNDLFGSIFNNYFLLLKTKNTKKKLVWGKGVCFCFVFSVFLKTIFLRIIKICFHCFFSIQIIYYFSCFLFFFFCVFLTVFSVFIFIKVSSTQPPHPHSQNLFFFFKLLKLLYLHMVTKLSFL